MQNKLVPLGSCRTWCSLRHRCYLGIYASLCQMFPYYCTSSQKSRRSKVANIYRGPQLLARHIFDRFGALLQSPHSKGFTVIQGFGPPRVNSTAIVLFPESECYAIMDHRCSLQRGVREACVAQKINLCVPLLFRNFSKQALSNRPWCRTPFCKHPFTNVKP